MFEVPLQPVQASFSHGEVSPDLFGRVDLQAYGSGLRTSRNAFIKTEGAWCNRQGSQYIGNAVNTTTRGSVLMPFVFSSTQSYVIEIGAGSAQVFSNGAVITTAGPAIASIAITLVAGVQTTFIGAVSPHGLSVGQNVVISGNVGTGAYSLNGSWTVVSVTSSMDFTIVTGLGTSGAVTTPGNIGVPLVISTPYSVADLPNLRYTQSANTLTVVHPKYPPYELTRLSANSFQFIPGVYNNGPFIPTNTDGTTLVYASAQSGTVTLTSTAAIFNANHVGSLFYLQQQDVSPITPWQADLTLTLGGASPIGYLVSSNLKNYKCVAYTADGTNAIITGDVAPEQQYGTVWDGIGTTGAGTTWQFGVAWQFTDFGYGVVKITGFTNSTHVTAVVQAVIPGQPALLPAMVVGGPVTAFGPFNFTGDGTTTTFGTLTATTSADPNQYYVTVGGLYVQPPNYTISAAAGNIVFITPPANAAPIAVIQLGSAISAQRPGLYATSFWAFGAFSTVQGYPSTVSYFPDRLIFAGTPQQPVGVFASQTSQYHNFAVSNPVVNSDAFTVFLNSRQLNTISDLIPLQDLIVGTANTLWRLWPGQTGTALGPLSISAVPQAFVGETGNAAAVLYGDSMLYAIYGGRRIRDLIYQFQFDKYVGSELTAYARHLIPFGVQVLRMAYAPDPWGQLFVYLSNGAIITCTYVREQQMIAWSRWDTGPYSAPTKDYPFGQPTGTFEDICVVPENNSYALYVLANRTINGQTARYVERMSQWEWPTTLDYKFMDCSLTYDGRNTSVNTMTVTGGTTWLSGDTGTLTASGAAGWAGFQPTDVGLLNQIQLFDAAGKLSRVLITAVTSSTIASVRFIDPIPADLQAAPTLTWTFARTTFGGAQQLAGQLVACLIDSNAYAGTNGLPILTVGLDGSVTLPNAGGVVTIGLQNLSDLETLALNQPGMETIRERAKGIPGLYLDVHYTRGLLTGTDFKDMSPIKERDYEPYLSPTNLQEGIIQNRIDSEFDSEAHVCVRQSYPVPVTIRMVLPSVNVGEPVG
jgi:hypothetical protein